MILELVAGRIIAPYVGVSLYTWTSVIGVVLAGMSLGYYVGGRLADRWASLRLLGAVFLTGGLASVVVLAVDGLGRLLPNNWPIILQILVLTAALFFLPSMILGAVSPIVAKLAVRDLAKTGSTVGRIYAAGTVGSIVGTFATGFFLISWFGTHTIVWGVAVVLWVLGLALFLAEASSTKWRRASTIALVAGIVVIAGGTALAQVVGWLGSPCVRESNYFCIKVLDEERDGEPVRVLVLDRLVHSYSSLTNPQKLVYGYERIYAELTAYRAEQDDHLRALFIGGGGYTFPRYVEAVYPGADIHVIEIDPAVTQVAYQRLGLDPNSTIVSYNEDARMFMERPPTDRYDVIYGDAFNDYSVPYHLTTKEFNDDVRAWLADDGLYVVNIIDGPRRDFLRAYAGTLRQTFPYVYVIPSVQGWRESPRVTFVIVGANSPLDSAALGSVGIAGDQALAVRQLLSPEQTDALLAEGRTVTLTDHYAPVDQMLAPVFRDEQAAASQTAATP